jgi:hypothetical protein
MKLEDNPTCHKLNACIAFIHQFLIVAFVFLIGSEFIRTYI